MKKTREQLLQLRVDALEKANDDLSRRLGVALGQLCSALDTASYRQMLLAINGAPPEQATSPWTPFVEATLPDIPRAKLIEAQPGHVGTFLNSRYQVQIRDVETPVGPVTWLCIVRCDRAPVHDWRDLQRIKNELMGPEREGCELYPAESRLVDTNNQAHMFVLPAGVRFPWGYKERDVGTEQMPGSKHKQRPFENPPQDLNARGVERTHEGDGS